MELLSPAGHWEAMVAAVQNGADAVYLGCGDFNARRGAKNFTFEELDAAVAYCHERGVRLYLTLNTLLTDRELPAAADALRRASRCGVDAVIVQDWGLAALARQITPDLPLHGSTQMTVHDLSGVEAAARLGMQCVVLSREVSGADVAFICRHSPIKIEVFGHGALCMCYSGQCAMSALIGGRSGNRGACAQPCRLPYRMDGGKTGNLLSLKDANLADHLGELEEMGVAILKLEGRMKRPEYVAVITAIYARLLREKRGPTGEERLQLEQAFSRDGFTDGYWTGRTGAHMFGSRGENAQEPTELFRSAKTAYDRENLRTVPVSLFARIRPGVPAQLTAQDGDGREVLALGEIPQAAVNRALTAEELCARLGKTGGTVFRAEALRAEVSPGLSLSASAVNGLRRQALEQLAALRRTPPVREDRPAPPLPLPGLPAGDMDFTVSLSAGGQLTDALMALSPAAVYLPAERIGAFDLSNYVNSNILFCVTLPRICTDRQRPQLIKLLEQARDKGCTRAAVGNLGHAALARDMGFILRGDYGLNVFNSRSLAEAAGWGLESACLSFELRWEQIRDLAKPVPCEAVVYGRLPLMVTENCIIANAHGCGSRDLSGACRTGHTLTDRRGEAFPVLSVFGCRSEIENAKTLFLADKPELRRCGLTWGRLRFTTETGAQCVRVLQRYRELEDFTPDEYTRGLFFRGVE